MSDPPLEKMRDEIVRLIEVIDSMIAYGCTPDEAQALRAEVARIQARVAIAEIASRR